MPSDAVSMLSDGELIELLQEVTMEIESRLMLSEADGSNRK